LGSDKQTSSNKTVLKRIPSSFLKVKSTINYSSVFFVILPYLPLTTICKLQALSKRFYESFIPLTITNLNQIGGAGLGRQPVKKYLKECLMQVGKTAGLAKWTYEHDKSDSLEKVVLSEKVRKNKHTEPFIRIKQTFEGNAAKIIPMT